MGHLLLLVLGLVLTFAGGRRAWGRPRRSDEQRWAGFLVFLAGIVAVIAALTPTHS